MAGTTLTFDDELYQQKVQFFQAVLANHSAELEKHPSARAAVLNQMPIPTFLASSGFMTSPLMHSESKEIRELAEQRQIEIKDERGSLLGRPSISISTDPKFGELHKQGMLFASLYTDFLQFFRAYYSPIPNLTWIEYTIPPLAGLVTAIAKHPRPYNLRAALTSCNHVSLPTVGLYSVTSAGRFAVNYGLQSLATQAMTAAGISTAGVTTVSMSLPVAFGIVTVAAYKYAHPIAYKVADKVSNCAYSIGSMFKNCGLKLWSTCCAGKKEAAEQKEQLSSPFLKVYR